MFMLTEQKYVLTRRLYFTAAALNACIMCVHMVFVGLSGLETNSR